MKVEKINDNKAIITLTINELENYQITLNDIKNGNKNVENFFFELLDDSKLINDFDCPNSELYIEAAVANNNLLTITITKAEFVKKIDNFNLSLSKKFSYIVSSNYYSFDNLNNLYYFCKKAKEENLFTGNNSLYYLNNKYILQFSNNTIKSKEFIKTFSVISEYTDKYYSSNLFKKSFSEYAKLLISKQAIQTIQEF